MKKQIIFAGFLLALGFLGANLAQAKKISEVQFPVAELGGCADKEACRTYCNDPAHIEACADFGEKQGLMSQEQANSARTFAKVMSNKAIKLPGGAKNPAEAKKYCSDPAHADECLKFAEENHLVSAQELRLAKKLLPILKAGGGPGGCTDKESCQKYCSDPAHADECLAFAQKNGLIKAEQVELAKKIRNEGGPGGCRSEGQCEQFCNDPANQETCLQFAQEHNLIKREDAAEIKDTMGQLRSKLHQNVDVMACIQKNVDQETLSAIERGTFVPGKDSSEVIKKCFEKFSAAIRQEAKNKIDGAPEDVKKCLLAAAGDNGLAAIKTGQAPDPTVADKIRDCFSRSRDNTESLKSQNGTDKHGPDNKPFMSPVQQCVMKALGITGLENKDSVDKEKLAAATRACAQQQLNRQSRHEGDACMGQAPEADGCKPKTTTVKPQAFDMPAQNERCLKAVFGERYKDTIQNEKLTSEQVNARIAYCTQSNHEEYKWFGN